MHIEVNSTFKNGLAQNVTVLAALLANGAVYGWAVMATGESGQYVYTVNLNGEAVIKGPSYHLIDPSPTNASHVFELDKYYESETGRWIGKPLALDLSGPGMETPVNVMALWNTERSDETPEIRVFKDNRSLIGNVVLYRGRETTKPHWVS